MAKSAFRLALEEAIEQRHSAVHPWSEAWTSGKLDRRLLGVPPRPVGVLFGWKVGFKDRFQNQRCRRHADPIPHARDPQRPESAVGLRYKHSSDWLWSVSLLPERKRQFSQPPLDPIGLDVRKILAVDPRRAPCLCRGKLLLERHWE